MLLPYFVFHTLMLLMLSPCFRALLLLIIFRMLSFATALLSNISFSYAIYVSCHISALFFMSFADAPLFTLICRHFLIVDRRLRNTLII